jgi:hypothetical protein
MPDRARLLALEEDGWDDEEISEHDCGMGPDGQCSLAATEWCDWDCPRGRAALRAKAAEASDGT